VAFPAWLATMVHVPLVKACVGEQTVGVDDEKVTGKPDEAVATEEIDDRATTLGIVGKVMVCESRPTETETELLVTPLCDAMIDEEPCDTPVTVVPLMETTALVAVYVGVMEYGLPN